MKKSQPKTDHKQIKEIHETVEGNKIFKTTNINILLNRVRIEKKSQTKKKIILSVYALTIISIVSILALGI